MGSRKIIRFTHCEAIELFPRASHHYLSTSHSNVNVLTTFSNVSSPVRGIEVVSDVYKFDLPFLADKMVWEKTINQFKADHPELKINYIYTGPSELNSKKKTHMLLYVFTEKRI